MYLILLRRYNEETKFPVTPSFVLTHSSDSIFVTHISYITIKNCWFSVSRHSKQIKIKKSLESGNTEKVDMQRLSPRFRSQQLFLWEICGETFSSNLQSFVWRRHVGAHLHGHQHGGRKPAETSVTEFCYKSVNLSL